MAAYTHLTHRARALESRIVHPNGALRCWEGNA